HALDKTRPGRRSPRRSPRRSARRRERMVTVPFARRRQQARRRSRGSEAERSRPRLETEQPNLPSHAARRIESPLRFLFLVQTKNQKPSTKNQELRTNYSPRISSKNASLDTGLPRNRSTRSRAGSSLPRERIISR